MIPAPYIIDGLLIITFVIGLFNFKKYKHTPLKYFLWFLGYGLLTEFSAFFFAIITRKPNHIFFNIYTLVFYLFYFWLLSKYFKKRKTRNLVKLFTVFIVIFFIVNTLFLQNIYERSQSYFLFFGDMFFIVAILLFFVEIINSEAVLKLKNLLVFWVVVGVLLFELGYIPVYLANKYINYSQGTTYGYILLLLNLISCTCFSLGFIWSKKKTDY